MDILILAVLILALFIAVTAIKRGHKTMKASKNIDDKKIRYGLWLISAVHMCAGIIIVLISAIIIFIAVSSYIGG